MAKYYYTSTCGHKHRTSEAAQKCRKGDGEVSVLSVFDANDLKEAFQILREGKGSDG